MSNRRVLTCRGNRCPSPQGCGEGGPANGFDWEPCNDTPDIVFAGPDRTIAKDTMLPDDNPKTRFGVTKPPMHLVPGTAIAITAAAFRDGSIKYGPYNWREQPVSASTYVAAAMRHLEQWWNREENAQDSGVHHLGHAAACLFILMDAEFVKVMNDDRPPFADMQALYESLTVGMKA